jgi:signal transduction histidine kinase/DNA-binding response OmpR family regulator
LCLVITIAWWKYSDNESINLARQRFEFRTSEICIALNNRIYAYEHALRGGLALFSSVDNISRSQWWDYVSTLNLQQNYPGIQGMGYSPVITSTNKEQHIETIRRQGFPEYTIRPPGERLIYTPVVYLEPADALNQRAIGYDTFSEPVRRVAIERARDTGKPSITEKITLAQETTKNVQAGFIMFFPFYARGAPVFTLEERRLAITGYINAPFRMNDFMRGLTEKYISDLSLEVFDNVDMTDHSLMYRNEDLTSASNSERKPLFTSVRQIELYGHPWTVRFQSLPAFESTIDQRFPHLILVAGLCLSLLLFLIAFIQAIAMVQSNKMTTALRESEASAQEMAAKAEIANVAKSDFLANMSHEIRTPLNAILGFTQLMLRDPHMGPDHRRYLETVYRSGEHLLALLNAILEMTKIEAGRTRLNITNFDFRALLDDLEAMFRVLALKKSLSLEISVDPDLPQWVRGDEQKLHQVLNNLLGNAVKFTDRGGVLLRVRLSPPETQSVAELGVQHDDSSFRILFEVEDTGPGIPENARQSIFSHFEQLMPGNRMKGGTGLGLAIAKAYVEAMGDNIEVVSRLGGGSVFRFALTLQAGSPVGARDQLKAHRIVRLKPGQGEVRILVVDDNETNREILARLLQDAAFDVREASGGQQACELFESWRPHLVLLDMVMPDVDGFEVLRRIQASATGAATPVIAVTASVLMEEKERVLSSGACAFLKKPFKAEELFDLLQHHLGVAYQDIGDAEAVAEDGPTQDQDQQDSAPVSISGLSSDLAGALREAALSLDVERLRELLALIAREDAPLSKRLLKLVENYQFEELQEVFTRH